MTNPGACNFARQSVELREASCFDMMAAGVTKVGSELIRARASIGTGCRPKAHETRVRAQFASQNAKKETLGRRDAHETLARARFHD